MDIDCVFWEDDNITDKTIFLIRAIIYSYIYSHHISSFSLKDDEFVDSQISQIKSQLELINNNIRHNKHNEEHNNKELNLTQYPEEHKQHFILYSLILLILDYANLLNDEEDNNSNTSNITNNINNRNNNSNNNNYKKESLKLLIYLMQNSLYKYIINNKNDYNNKLILIDPFKLKLLLNDTKTKNYFILLLSHLKLEYILDLMTYVNKNFINNCREYNNLKSNIKNDVKETNSLIRHITRAIKFIKNNIIPLLLLSKLITDVAKTMLQQFITEIKDNNLNKSKTPTKTTNKFFDVINRLFSK